MRRVFKNKKTIIAILVIGILCASIYIVFRPGGWLHDRGRTKYYIDAVLYPEEGTVSGNLKVQYKNNEGVGLNSLYFHLYPNAFKERDRVPFPPEEMVRAYPNGFSPGHIDIKSLILDGEPVPFNIRGYSYDKLEIPLAEELRPGRSIGLDMEFIIQLPNSPGRFGYGENTYNLGNWYPILCVYDERGWNLEPYYALGDPFYSAVADYRVTIEVPEGYEVAATGERIKTRQGEYGDIMDFKAENVRDFAWVASRDFRISERKVGDTRIYSYHYTKEGGEEALDYAAVALNIFNEIFGEYPYKNLSVVQADFFIGGMEYPRLVMIDRNLYNSEDFDWLEIVTVHEVAHQWWYGLVGNDQVHDAWLDEGLTEYSTILYYYKRFGDEVGKEKYRELITKGKYQIYKILRDEEGIDETIHRPLYEFGDWLEYDSLVYGKGAMMFHHMRERMGDETFFRVLKEYLQDNWLKNVEPETFRIKCEEVTGKSWKDFFDEWLYDG